MNANDIIVVDDDSALREMLTEFFTDHSVSATPASNRAELNRHMDSMEPSLTILDLQLGRDDGLDILRDIRSSGNRIEVPCSGWERWQVPVERTCHEVKSCGRKQGQTWAARHHLFPVSTCHLSPLAGRRIGPAWLTRSMECYLVLLTELRRLARFQPLADLRDVA
jgi:Response regulator receiver domain